MEALLSPDLLVAITGSGGLALALLYILLRKKRPTADAPEKIVVDNPQAEPETLVSPPAAPPVVATTPAKNSWWSALAKTRSRFFFSRSTEVKDLKEALEEACLTSDLGVQNTEEAFAKVPWSELGTVNPEERLVTAKRKLSEIFQTWVVNATSTTQSTWPTPRTNNEPFVIWFVGVNGVGKTTSIAKFGQELKQRGFSVLFAAGDTFRAGAAEQLEIWAQRLDIPCIKGQAGGDSSAVLFDAINSAKAKNIQFVLCDSAGRLHNQGQLMEALAKNRRVMDKALSGAPHEVLLVLDGNTGQNMLKQAEEFQKSVGVTGLILTKLDGTARGGAVVAVARKTGLPIQRLGLGESAEDFAIFEPRSFSDALLGLENA